MNQRLHITGLWQPSLWAHTAVEGPVCPPLEGNVETDVAIIGAGFTGLSAALHLAEAGRNVIVVDSFGPGWGCSGRNGGQVNPAWKVLPEELEQKLGAEQSGRAMMMANDACDLVFSLIERFSLDCEAVRPGYVQGAYGSHGRKFLEEWVRQWGERGVETTLLEKQEVADLIGTDAYGCAMYDARGGSIQPFSFARGLARAAVAAGAVVHGDSKVVACEREGSDWHVKTASGAIKARHVLWCTNGYTDDVWPGLKQSIVPVATYIIATDPLNPEQRAVITPGRHAVSETARIQTYYRVDAAGRMVFGGRGNVFNTRLDGGTTYLEQQAIRMFPCLEGETWRFRWGGHVAITTDGLPRMMKIENNVYTGLGYSGRGVAMATMMGRELCHLVLGGETLLDATEMRKIPLHAFRQAGISWTVLKGRLLDRLDGA